jgi:hypothetical protein
LLADGSNCGNRHAVRSLHSRLHQNEVIDPIEP